MDLISYFFNFLDNTNKDETMFLKLSHAAMKMMKTGLPFCLIVYVSLFVSQDVIDTVASDYYHLLQLK